MLAHEQRRKEQQNKNYNLTRRKTYRKSTLKTELLSARADSLAKMVKIHAILQLLRMRVLCFLQPRVFSFFRSWHFWGSTLCIRRTSFSILLRTALEVVQCTVTVRWRTVSYFFWVKLDREHARGRVFISFFFSLTALSSKGRRTAVRNLCHHLFTNCYYVQSDFHFCSFAALLLPMWKVKCLLRKIALRHRIALQRAARTW